MSGKGQSPPAKKSVSRREGPRKAKLAERAGPYSVTGLEAILTPILALGRHEQPSRSATRILATQLNVLRSEFKMEHDLFRESYIFNKTGQDAITTLIEALEYFKKRLVSNLEIHQSSAADEIEDWMSSATIEAIKSARVTAAQYFIALEQGDRLIADLNAIKAPSLWFVDVVPNPKFVKSWADICDRLEEIVVRALPDIGPGVTRGTLNKVLAALIPSITGETPTEEAIYDFRRKRPNRNVAS